MSAAPAHTIPNARQAGVQRGLAEARTLGEILAVDHAELLGHVLPDASVAVREAVREAQSLGILARMQAIGAVLGEHIGEGGCRALTRHHSDTVRGWGWFALAELHRDAAPADLVALLRPAADDPHFGVREWAWLSVRPLLAARLAPSIAALAALTSDPSERVRRFACEALRPRGVWAAHIPALKNDPGQGVPVLEPLRADPSKYVQDSVGNWINDAAKTAPEWAIDLTDRWLRESPVDATERIVRRGRRSLT